jgi:hypothetical protein
MNTGQSDNRGCVVGVIIAFLLALLLGGLAFVWLVTFGIRGGPAP